MEVKENEKTIPLKAVEEAPEQEGEDKPEYIIQGAIDKIPNKALVLCLNCDYLDCASSWKKKQGQNILDHGKCPMCHSQAWKIVAEDDLEEREPHPIEDGTETEEVQQ